jgi:signal transduction histidine kinase
VTTALSIRRARTSLILRVVLLLGCLALAYLIELPARDMLWIVALMAAGGVACLAERDERLGLAGRALEALVCAAAINGTGQDLSPVLPYLIAPVFASGLQAGGRAAMITAGFGAAGLLAGIAFPIGEGRAREFSAAAAQWTVIALLAGGLATWVRRLEDNARTAATTSYSEAHRLLSQLYTVTRQLPGSLDPVTTADGLLDDVERVTAYDNAAVLVRAGGDRLVPLAHRGDGRLEWDVDLRGDNPFAEAWASELPQTRDTRFSRNPDEPVGPWPGSSLVVPLRIGVRLFGLVGVESISGSAFPDSVVRRVTELVAETALRLDTGLLFDEVREVATTEERRRLAREIHDGIAQELASLGYVVDGLAAHAGDGLPAALDADLARLRHEITRLVRELRLSIFELRSDVDRHGGLGAALSDYLRTIGTASGFTVHLTLDEAARRLPAEIEAELLRIAQEAISNARRHSTAENLWVTCRIHPPSAQLVVEDDGNGLGGGREGGFGLDIMRERAGRLRAKLDIRAREPHGTYVEVRLGSPSGGTPGQQGPTEGEKLIRTT